MSGMCYNFAGYSHQQLYDMIHSQGGVQCDSGPAQAWGDFATVMNDAHTRVTAALNKAGVQWEGAASDATTSGISPLAHWSLEAHHAGTATQSSVQTQTAHYDYAATTMPKPVDVTASNGGFFGIPSGVTHLLGGQTDADKQEAAAQAAKAEAVRTMTTYQTTSQQATANVGTFSQPPQVAVDVPPPNNQTSSIGTAGGFSGGGSVTPAGTSMASAGGMVAAPPSTSGGGITTGSASAGPVTGSPVSQGPGFGGSVPPGGGGGQFGSRPFGPGFGGQPFPRGGAPFGEEPLPSGRGGSGFGRGAGFGRGGPGEEFGPGRGGAGRGGGLGAGRGGANEITRGGNRFLANSEGRPGSGRAGGIAEEGVGGQGGRGGGVGGGRGRKREEDDEYQRADYLVEMEDVWGDGEQLTAPPVIGETPQ